jgi:predicted RNA-binding protein with RPS1 domain
VDLRPTRRLEDYVGEEIEAKIINFDRRRANVVLSRKVMLEAQISTLKDETLAHLEEGAIVTGTVKNITDYGVFIDLGGIDGLLHVTDISWGRVGHPSEYFKVGDEVKVVVLRVDKEKERVSLGYRQRFEDPWTHVEARYPVGKKVAGKVTNVVDYGAFVELEWASRASSTSRRCPGRRRSRTRKASCTQPRRSRSSSPRWTSTSAVCLSPCARPSPIRGRSSPPASASAARSRVWCAT